MDGLLDSSIEFDQLSKSYGAHRVLDDVTVRVRPGTVTGLLGPNGSGKTTALRILLGLERPDGGEARVGKRRIRELDAPYRYVGALLDASWVHPQRSARAQLNWIAHASGLPVDVVQPSLEEVGLVDVADAKVGTFSLGMRQRLGIASTLLGDPSILIYDEPLNGLDHDGVEWVRSFFLRQTERGRTVLLSSHLLSEVELTAGDVVVIGRGSVLYAGETGALAEGASAVEFDVDDSAEAAATVERLADSLGWRIESRSRRRGGQTYTVSGASLADVAAALAEVGLAARRIQDRGSLEDAYARLTADRIDFVGH
ncbi:MAG: ATP-binding cassette domain-containing protein [Actinomycetia bacterium]|nr:ATP-binding cassette domain-containing protein [Actinomycetes bacterium]